MAQAKPIPVFGTGTNFVFPPHICGVATYKYPCKSFEYTGEWKNGKKNGHGRFEIGKSSYYDGDFTDGEMTGKGTRVFPNGSHYSGDFLNGEFHGIGTFESPNNGVKYEGDWVDNKYNGSGILTFADGTKYTGKFVNHLRHGQGVYTDSAGNHYEGEWSKGVINGQGKMIYSNGDIYEGSFLNGKRHGDGSIKWASNGFSIAGKWDNDKIEYHPSSLQLSELPPFSPGSSLGEISVKIIGGEGENGRVLKFSIEAGKNEANVAPKKSSKSSKKIEVVDKEPKFIPLNPSNGETFLLVTAENGVAKLPQIQIPAEAEQNVYTLMVEDQTQVNPLPSVSADFVFLPAGMSMPSADKGSAKGKNQARRGRVSAIGLRGKK